MRTARPRSPAKDASSGRTGATARAFGGGAGLDTSQRRTEIATHNALVSVGFGPPRPFRPKSSG